jgi:hypothetical protein
MDREKIINQIIKEINKDIFNLSDEDLLKIQEETHKIKIKFEKIKNKDDKSKKLTNEMMDLIISELSVKQTRDDGNKLLIDKLKTRKEVEQFAKYLNVSYLKQDNMEYIINKIVEATVGAILRSNAIKGINNTN